MPGLSRQQKQLSKALLDLDEEAMLIEELDGFIAGLLVCPQMIPPSAWLPWVWNSADAKGEPVFESLDHTNKVMGLVMAYYNDVARTLFDQPERYGPIVSIDRRNGEILWEIWIEGFEKAVKLKPEAWVPLATADIEAARAWTGLMMLADVARRDPRFSDEQIDAITATAHDKIADWVIELNDWRLANAAPAPTMTTRSNPFAAPAQKVGRNDPCPCGSGKKHKKCCGLN